MRPLRSTRAALAGLFALLAFVGTGCLPIENPPAGGGEVEQATYRLGPFNLAPMGQEGDQDQGFQFDIPRPEGSFGMKTMNFDIVDAGGNPVATHDAHLHHVVLGTSAAQDTYCPGGERFAGAGAERNPIELPDPYAYLVDADDSWSATWHVMNTSDEAMEVYIEYEIGYQPGADAGNSRGVNAFFLDVTGCRAQYDVPGDGGPDSVHTATRTWQAPWDGWLVTAVGHLHAGGISLTLRDDLSGRECTMNARYDDGHGHGGHGDPPSEITRCPVHYPVEAGQDFTVISRYRNSEPHQGVMGIVRAYAWQGSQ